MMIAGEARGAAGPDGGRRRRFGFPPAAWRHFTQRLGRKASPVLRAILNASGQSAIVQRWGVALSCLAFKAS